MPPHSTTTRAIALLALLLPLPIPAQGAPALDRLERELAADVVRDSVGSITAAAFVGDRVEWTGAFGWADRSSRTLATERTIYRAGSLTKPVTALVLLRLVADGTVALDDPVAPHLPELLRLPSDDALDRRITFRQLATHTAGLAREPDPVATFARGPFRDWKRRVVAAIPSTGMPHSPGGGYHYSNIGYGILGFALERAAGRPFEVLADSLVVRPLRMTSASFFPDDDARARIATGYVNVSRDSIDPRVPRAEHRGRGYRVPSGGLYATARDLARLGMALTGALPLIPDSLRQTMLDVPTEVGYGVGVQVFDIGGVRLAGHSGTVAGYTAYLLTDPERQTGIVLLRNYNSGGTNVGAAATRFLLELRGPVEP